MYGTRYYPDRFNPYNRHDTGMYVVYRARDNKHIGYVENCHSDSHAERVAYAKFGCKCYVSHIEE